MRYVLMGRTGLRISELCLGTMTFGEDWGWGAPLDECRKMFEAFAEAGGNFIDTANYYTGGSSERILGQLLGKERDRFVLATKYTLVQREGDPNAAGNQRKNMVQSLEASLSRLGTSYIDVYWVHAYDGITPIEETLRGLDDLVRSGKILYAGISDAPAWVVSRANTMADLRGWTRFAGLQIQWSLVERSAERDLLPMARSLDLAVTPWSVLGGGLLSGKFADGKGPADARLNATGWGEDFLTERNLKIAKTVAEIARELGSSSAQVAVNWVRQRTPGVIVPILGARKLAQLKDNLGCLEFEIPADHMARLEEASRIDTGFPQDFLGRDNIRRLYLGDTKDRILAR